MFQPTRKGEVIGNVTTVGIDLAKNVFSFHGVDADGAVVLRKTVSRARLMEVVVQQPAGFIVRGAGWGGHRRGGAVVWGRAVWRAGLMEVVVRQRACLIGLEACSGAHEWARRFQELGHTVKLMAPRFVAPYRKNGKNDGNDD